MAKIPLTFFAKTNNKTVINNKSSQFYQDYVITQNLVHQRDDFICQCCDFRDQTNQQLLFIDGNFSNFEQSNLATICSLCHQSFCIGDITMRNDSKIIWLPELSQVKLNHLVRPMFIVKYRSANEFLAKTLADTGNIAYSLNATMQHLIAFFKSRENLIIARFGTSDPFQFAEAIQTIPQSTTKTCEQHLANLRIIPSEIFSSDLHPTTTEMVASWYQEQGAFFHISPTTWLNLLQSKYAKTTTNNQN